MQSSNLSVDAIEIVRHARAIHFAQLAIGFVLLSAAFVQPATDIDRALQQLDRVSTISAAAREAEIRQFFDKPERCQVPVPPPFISPVNTQTELAQWQFKMGAKRYYPFAVTIPKAGLYWVTDPMTSAYTSSYFDLRRQGRQPDRELLLAPFPGSSLEYLQGPRIGDFEHGWSAIRAHGSAVVIAKLWPEKSIFDSEDPPKDLPPSELMLGPLGSVIENNTLPIYPNGTFQFLLTDVDVDKLPDGQTMFTRFHFNDKFRQLATMELAIEFRDPDKDVGEVLWARLPVDVVKVSCQPLTDLLKFAQFPASEVASLDTTFDRAFNNFYELTKGLESATLDDLRGYLQRLRDEKGREIELYGARIPQDKMAIWGVVLLLTFQFYFVAHLTRITSLLNNKNAVLPPVAWIAIYRDRLSRSIVFLSLILAPATMVALAAKNWGANWGLILRSLECVAACTSLALAYTAWRQITIIRNWTSPVLVDT